MSFVKTIFNKLLAWKTDRKIVVIESDDWGTIRMPSKEAFVNLKSKGYPVDSNPYNSFDSLETNSDIEDLSNVLHKFKDDNGNHPTFTLNYLSANPDFERIVASDFQDYAYTSIKTTYSVYKNTDRVIELVKKGMDEGLFSIEFHGREHLNVERWMSDLKSGSQPIKDAIEAQTFTVNTKTNSSGREDYLDAFGLTDTLPDSFKYENIISSGIDLFQNIWGFGPKGFIAPCYTWNSEIEETLNHYGIKYIQGTNTQRIPLKDGLVKRKFHYLGQKNKYNQIYLTRNCFFEPTSTKSDNVNLTMKQITAAFESNMPAIICSHRVNYMSGINEQNKFQGLEKLERLLSDILKTYPDVEFYSSSELGKIIGSK